MKIFAIHTGNNNEGGGIEETAYLKYDNARERALELIKKEQELDREVYGKELGSDTCPIHEWKEWREDFWTNGCDNIQIQEIIIQESSCK